MLLLLLLLFWRFLGLISCVLCMFWGMWVWIGFWCVKSSRSMIGRRLLDHAESTHAIWKWHLRICLSFFGGWQVCLAWVWPPTPKWANQSSTDTQQFLYSKDLQKHKPQLQHITTLHIFLTNQFIQIWGDGLVKMCVFSMHAHLWKSKPSQKATKKLNPLRADGVHQQPGCYGQ